MDTPSIGAVEAAEALLKSLQPAGAQRRPGIPSPPVGTAIPQLSASVRPVRWRTDAVTEIVASVMVAWGTVVGRVLIVVGCTLVAASLLIGTAVYALCH